jgi:hypothetical protein
MTTHLLIPFRLYLYRSFGQLDGFALLECICTRATSMRDTLHLTIPRRKTQISFVNSQKLKHMLEERLTLELGKPKLDWDGLIPRLPCLDDGITEAFADNHNIDQTSEDHAEPLPAFAVTPCSFEDT